MTGENTQKKTSWGKTSKGLPKNLEISDLVMNLNTLDGRNPFAPLWSHRKPLFVGLYRESSCQGFVGGAGLRPSTVLLCCSSLVPIDQLMPIKDSLGKTVA